MGGEKAASKRRWKRNVLPGVDIRLGAVRLSTIELVVDEPTAKVFTLDMHSKYVQGGCSTGTSWSKGKATALNPQVMLLADEETLHTSTAPSRIGEATLLSFSPEVLGGDRESLGRWRMLVESARYTTTVFFWLPAEPENEDNWAMIERSRP